MILRREKRHFFRGMSAAAVVTIVFVFSALSAHAEDRVVTLGVYENPPKVFTDESGKPGGIFIDIIEYIADLEGWELQYRIGAWSEGLDRLERGEIDLMPDVAYSAAREELFDFHEEPLLSDWFQVYARKGSGIKSIVDLDGKRVVVLERSVQHAAFEKTAEGFGLHITLVPLPDYGTIFEEIAEGNADAAVTNRFYGLTHAKQYGLENTAVVFNPTRLYFAAPKGKNGGLLRAIDRRLVRVKEDPGSVYYDSLRRWTSEDVKFVLPAWVKITGIVVAAVLLTSLAGSFLLKRRIDLRTRELRELNREMEKRIQDRTAELAEATEKAQAADRTKSAFLATMSHELRTPLNSIIGFTGILLQELAGPLNEEQEKQLTMVRNSSRHLLALINDILDISKIEASQLSLSETTFFIREAVEKAVEIVRPMAEGKGLDIRLEITADIGEVRTDRRRFEQIALNLLTNAVKFTDEGAVGVNCRREGDWYVLAVTDTGIGIRREEIAGLFRPFHQIDTGTARKHEGTGLGLAICKKLTKMMGGDIAVESAFGRGSTFTVRFPAEEERSA